MATTSLTDWPWRHWCQIKPEATALLNNGTAVSWRQLAADVDALALPLSSATDKLAMTSINNYQTLITLFALWQRGVATLLLNPAFSAGQRNEILDKAGVSAFLHAEVAFDNGAAFPAVPFQRDAVLTLTLTSGSSGVPKAVAHSAGNHIASALGLFSLMPYEASDCWLLSLPLFHISGMAIVWRWLTRGAMLKIADTRGDALLSALEGVSHASLVPTQLQRVLAQGETHTLQSVLLGGAAIPQVLVDSAEKAGIRCWCGYGMTEMASTVTAKRADGRFSVGQPLPNREVLLSDEGEIWVRGKTLSPGYLVNGVLVPLAEDWFATKDKGDWLAECQELRIVGRLDNMFVCGGENVQPEDVERQLSGYPGLTQLFILPVPHPKWGAVPVALTETYADPDTFLAWAAEKLPPHQRPQKLLVYPATLDSGGIKLSRARLAQWLAEQNPLF